MKSMKSLCSAVGLVLLGTACVSQQLERQIAYGDIASSDHWRTVLVSPSARGQTVQTGATNVPVSANSTTTTGTAIVTPGDSLGQTKIVVRLSNGVAGLYSWHMHLGTCNHDLGVLGPSLAYPPIAVGPDGTGAASAIVPSGTPNAGNYFVDVHQSAPSVRAIIACGNLEQIPR
ncbi:MAG: hypothetical protein ABJD07_11695 [Gemmatimonadaceae bacterium]